MAANRAFPIILIALVFSVALADRCFWWTIAPSAEVFDSLGEVKRGATVGQTAIGPVSGRDAIEGGNYGFWNDLFENIDLCFTTVERFWDAGEADIFEFVSMEEEEFVYITNCGNCHIRFGLQYIENSLGWILGVSPERNRFSYRARFTENDDPPVVYSPTMDFIKDIVTWSSPTIFGPGGYDVPINGFVYLWFQLLTPMAPCAYGANIITTRVWAKSYLP